MNNRQNDMEARYLAMIENNVNVSKTSDLKEFFILVAGIVGLCIFVFIFADFIADIWIDNIADKTQVKIENVMSYSSDYINSSSKSYERQYASELAFLNSTKYKIMKMDKRLRGKSKFNIYVYPSQDLNAFVVPNGTIYFTQGLFKEVKDEQMLTFILAHEMAHYAHRDHLKASSRNIIAGMILSVLTSGQNQSLSTFVSNISVFNDLTYSKRQERDADLFANEVIIRMYGNNDAAIKFMKMIDEKQKLPQFMHYFSTHPAPSDRIYMLEHNKK